MATSSRQSALFGVNDWRAIYQTFREADFRSYDYETLRKRVSLIIFALTIQKRSTTISSQANSSPYLILLHSWGKVLHSEMT